MTKYDVIIVGGGPAGVTAAISARNTNPGKKIALIRRDKIAMIPCGIPYIMHTLDSINDNIMPDAPLEANNVDLIIDEVVDCKDKLISLKSGNSLEFDKLVLATGSDPFVPPIIGRDKKGVRLVTKEYNYLEELKSEIEKANNVVIVGGGFIGVEFADELLKAGKTVSIIEMLPSLLPLSVDEEFGKFIEDDLKLRGANVFTNIALKEILGDEKATGVLLADGQKLDADLVILSIGYRPNMSLGKKIGLEINDKFGIVVDNFGRTSVKDIFAIGDCCAKHNCYTNEYASVMLASTAGTEARLTGSNLFEINAIKSFPGVLGMINILATMIQNKMTDIEIDTMQIGTHPLLTASPIAYQIINATANALKKVYTKTV